MGLFKNKPRKMIIEMYTNSAHRVIVQLIEVTQEGHIRKYEIKDDFLGDLKMTTAYESKKLAFQAFSDKVRCYLQPEVS